MEPAELVVVHFAKVHLANNLIHAGNTIFHAG